LTTLETIDVLWQKSSKVGQIQILGQVSRGILIFRKGSLLESVEEETQQELANPGSP